MITAFIFTMMVSQYQFQPTQPYPGNQYNNQQIVPYVQPHWDQGGWHQGGVVMPSYSNGFTGGYETPHYENPSFDTGGTNRPYDLDHYFDNN